MPSVLTYSNSEILLAIGDRGNLFTSIHSFPLSLYSSGRIATWSFLQSFLEDYSTRGLSKASDRAVAISGLAARIQRVLRCEEHYGIFDLFLHRSLIWRRRDGQIMKRIEYGGKVPSWSWMAYEGGIQFTEDKFSDLDLFVDLRFDQSGALIAKAWEFKDCHVKRQTQDGTHPQILDSNEVKRGWIVYDVEDGEDCYEERELLWREPRMGRSIICLS